MEIATSSSPPSTAALNDLVDQSRTEIDDLITRHKISDEQADLVIDQTLEVMWYRWDKISQPRYWLVKTLERRFGRMADGSSGKAGKRKKN